MPIINYETTAARHESRIFESQDISTKNKQLLKGFLLSYDVSPARRSIFFERIRVLLERFPDLEAILTEREQVALFFADLRARYAPATFATYLNVCRRFLRWLNHGELPIALKDIACPGKAKIRRGLNPDDLITWDEAVAMCSLSSSVQQKAILAVQADGGFRPSEFYDLNYGDIRFVQGLAVVVIRSGKTGAREVVLFRSTQYLADWLHCHPSQKESDPLWISEYRLKCFPPRILRYEYPAMRKGIRTLARKAGIHKAVDFYALRHASCASDKRDNLPIDIGATRHGHSIKHFTETYGALDTEATVSRVREHFGTGSAGDTGSLAAMGTNAHQPHANSPPAQPLARELSPEERMRELELQLQDLMKKMQHRQEPPAGLPTGIPNAFRH